MTRHSTLRSIPDMRKNISEMKKEAFATTRSLYGIVLLALAPVIGITILALTISWNTTPIEMFEGMLPILGIIATIFQIVYLVIALAFWDASGLLSLVDTVLVVISPLSSIYWYRIYRDNNTLSPPEVTLFCILVGYMTLRLWIKAVQPNYNQWEHHIHARAGASKTLDHLTFVWTTRSASQVSRILPDLLATWNELAESWGVENAKAVCTISIHVTDPDVVACRLLEAELRLTDFDYKFSRIDIRRWIENHTLQMIEESEASHSLLAFCGSPQMAKEVHYHKISNDAITVITGNKHHQMAFVSESYGGPSRKKLAAEEVNENSNEPLTDRKTTTYAIMLNVE